MWPDRHIAIFATAVLAILPLAMYIGHATEALAKRLGPGIGALLNATFGNAAELIIGALALREGLTGLVKASITGSIIGNVLLVFGASALAAGVVADRIVLDPGLGFAKDAEHNWALLHDIADLVDMGYPLLVGASRKRFLGSLLAVGGEPRPPAERDDATVAISALSAAAGVWCVRVHDARGNVDAVRVADAWASAHE